MQVIPFQEFMLQDSIKGKEELFPLLQTEMTPISLEEAHETLMAILISFYLMYEY
jgi:hypothetical protein